MKETGVSGDRCVVATQCKTFVSSCRGCRPEFLKSRELNSVCFEVNNPIQLVDVEKIATLIKMEKGLMKEQREAEEELAIAMNQRLVKEVYPASICVVCS